MPEGPEIRRVASRISKVVANQGPLQVTFTQPHLHHFGEILSGRQVLNVTSRGKALLTQFEGALTVYSHNQLYGRWSISRIGRVHKTTRTLRFAMHSATHSALLYSASEIAVLSPEEMENHPFLTKLGPDALDDGVHWRDVLKRLMDKRFHKRSLAALYLDQTFIAGTGNYLRSEILHQSGVHPFDRPCDLTRKQLGLLARTTLSLSRQAYVTSGITNTPARVKRLKAAGIRRSRYRHLAFARSEQPCYRCSDLIERIEISGRRLYLCRRCQPKHLP
ncbi:MAG: endonuclease VIII [Pseudomonadales bacterium]|nr:endonuclease VIII [Pseudomonadales bacterium]